MSSNPVGAPAMRLTVFLALLGLGGSTLAPAASRPLPDIQLTTLDGTLVSSGDFARGGHWLLVYVMPRSASCRSLLQQLAPLADGSGTNVALIVGADAKQARALTEAYPGLTKATLYLDSSHQALRGMGLLGVPAVLGMRDATVEWTLGGALSDPKKLESILKTWLQ